MSLRKSARLSATPLRLFTDRVDNKASASSNSSNNSSPTFSLGDSFNSNDPSTSAVTEPDDYADPSAPHTVSSATMRSKSTTRRFSQSNIDHDSRRSSGRMRKPTAKAQALNGSRSYSPPLSDTIVIGSSSTREDSPTIEQAPATTDLPTEPVNQSPPAPEVPQVPETPASAKVNGAITPSKTPTEKDESLLTTIESPSRRISQRERKPTAKVLEVSSTAQKRSATDVEDVRPRKSARISLSGAKVPSKLRYSLSSATEEEGAVADDKVETVEIVDTIETIETPKKSKVVVLKSKRLSELNDPGQSPVAQKPQSPPSRRKSQRKVKVQDPSEGIVVVPPAPAVAVTLSSTVDTQFTCNLSCLAPSSRILAFAEIARRMPDGDDNLADDVVPGSVHDWRVYTREWCECNKLQPPIPTRTNSEELARALLPNTVAGSSKYEPIDLTESQPQATPEAELLSTPVNTILRASDAERLSLLFAAPASDNTGKDHNSLPAGVSIRRSSNFATPQVPAEPRDRFYPTNSIMYPSTTSPGSLPAKTPYEERIRQDHQKLTLIRKRAAAKGIQWSFNMTFDEIQALILEHEAVEDRLYLDSRFQSEGREHRMYHGQDPAARRRPSENSSTGLDMLLLPQGHSRGQTADNTRQRDLGISNGISNASHASNVSHAHGSPPTETLPPLADVLGMHYRRVSSPSRPKSSRFRVDPRGLRGESPGPGTIINMAEKRNSSGKQSRRSRGLRTDAGERV